MPDKLTDKEIIKALECCKYEYDTKCELCCYNFYSRTGCRSELRRNALDLINRLQAKVEKCEKVEHFADKTIETANAEIERLNKEVEIELDKLNAEKNDVMHYKDQIKSEAVKEFAERLKEQYAQGINWFGKKEHYFVNVEDIDNLLKELVGE